MRISSQLSTPVTNRIDKPINAALVGLTVQALPIIIAGTPAHRQSSKTKTARVIFSASASGPSASSFCRANCGAFGVRVMAGG
ncbi:hypothetical protein D3C81_2043260 [compost metagenome]